MNTNYTEPKQIKDPLAAELQDLAEEALDGVDTGSEPKPEKYIELVFGPEIVELEGFMTEIKVREDRTSSNMNRVLSTIVIIKRRKPFITVVVTPQRLRKCEVKIQQCALSCDNEEA